MTDRQRVIDELTKPFSPQAIEKKGKFDYVSGETVIYRLNTATNYSWDFEITGHEMVGGAHAQGNKPALVVYGRMRIPVISDGWRSDMGTQILENSPDDHEAHKGAVTDCIKRCARLFGVGLHLWGPDIEAGEIAPQRPAQQAPQQRQAPPPQQRQNGAQPDMGGPPMTDKQRGFLISLAKELGMVSDGGHHDAAALDAEITQFCGLTMDTLTVGAAKQVIEEFQIRKKANPHAEPHPMVQRAMDERDSSWVAAMEGCATIRELSAKGNEAIAAGAMTDSVRNAFNTQRDRINSRNPAMA